MALVATGTLSPRPAALIRSRAKMLRPVPRNGMAIAGIVIAIASSAFWAVAIVALLRMARMVETGELKL